MKLPILPNLKELQIRNSNYAAVNTYSINDLIKFLPEGYSLDDLVIMTNVFDSDLVPEAKHETIIYYKEKV